MSTRTYLGGDAATDVLYNIENIVGSVNADTITGDANNNTIEGGLGNDTLDGGAGTDTVSYASATSAITLNLATTTAQNTVGAGTDTITNFESILGSAFNDTLTGNTGNNIIEGGAGDDVMDGAAGTDTVSYSTATAGVTVSLATATSQNTVGAGSDTITNFENLTGSSFADTLTGSTGNNIITGGGGNDTIDGGAGTDTVVFSGNRKQYTITSGSDGGGAFYTIVDNRGASPDGTDKVYGTESFQFADGTIAAASLLNASPTAKVDSTTVFRGISTVFDPRANDTLASGTALSITAIVDTLGGGTVTNFSGAGSSVTLSNGTVLTLRS
ncbi:MAG: proprotein convertase P, partial [bacterium]